MFESAYPHAVLGSWEKGSANNERELSKIDHPYFPVVRVIVHPDIEDAVKL